MRFPAWFFGILLCGCLASAQARPVVVEQTETARDIVVSVSNPVIIRGTAEQGVFTAGANLTISGTVQGDVAVIGGELELLSTAQVHGNIFLVGSTQRVSPGATIEGKLLSIPFLGEETRRILTNPAAFLFSYTYDFKFIASRIFASLLLFLLSLATVKLFPAHVSYACGRMKQEPGYTAGMGVLGLTGTMVALLVALALCLVLIGLPILLLLILALIVAWIFGMVVVFCTVGEWILRLLKRKSPSPLWGLILAIGLWTLVKFLPGVSLLVHLAASVLALGITLTTRFGTGIPWFQRRRRTAPAHVA
jgi:hypothetical protein